MHKYMRAIGFSKLTSRKELNSLIANTVQNAERRAYTTKDDETMLAEFCKEFGKDIGIAVCGEFDSEDKFAYEYFYPYLKGSDVSSSEDISIERHISDYSYAGVCDDPRCGVTLIFYLQNLIAYIRYNGRQEEPVIGTTLTLSALSVKGSVILPIHKTEAQIYTGEKEKTRRSNILREARRGNNDAIERLMLDDMDTYSAISTKIGEDDVYSIVDNYFMPYGIECDLYSILGEILGVKEISNSITKEKVIVMRIRANDLEFDVAINRQDLNGEPKIGRRFKGEIWLQGYINYPDAVADGI